MQCFENFGGKMPQIYSSLRQSNLQLQNQAAQRSRQIRAVEHWRWRCAAGLAGAHTGLQDRILLKRINYARKCLFFIMYRYPQARNLGGVSSGETSTLGQGGQIVVVGARVKTVKYMKSSCSFNLGTTFLQHSFPYKLRPNPRPPALC